MGPLGSLLRRVIRAGTLTVIDAGGARHVFGDGMAPRCAIRLADRRLEWSIAFNPTLAAGEAYMDGRLVMEEGHILDLLDLFTGNLKWHPDNALRKTLDRRPRWLMPFQQWNDQRRARANVAHHYDLSGRLYDLFLDKDRQYSCAYFRSPEASLEQAQFDKKAHIAAKLLLDRPGLEVLEIGSGWGGLALYLNAACGARMTGVTLSTEQLGVSRGRAEAAGVAEDVRFELRDYRAVEGKFDRIVSVGMFEHVGKPFYQTYFDTACRLLKDDGVMLLHTIGRADGPGVTDPWTRKYIFPGGYTPALSELMPAIERAGLYVTDVEVLRLHYMHTLQHWYDRTISARAEIVALYDERFWRMWLFYLAGALCAFRHQGHVVFQIQLARTVDAVPLTRDYMRDAEARLLQQGPDVPTLQPA
ncbi:class I SAM-dependent methyltransferase [Parapedomonas caeni]